MGPSYVEEVQQEEEGSRSLQEPAGVADLSFFCALVRDPNTWGQRGLNGFIVKAASDADGRRERASARAN